jgi:uncharacterized membrane protein YeiB
VCRKWGNWHWRHAKPGPERTSYICNSVAVALCVAMLTAVLSFFPGEYNRLGPFEVFAVRLTLVVDQ